MRAAGWLARGRLREAREQFWLEHGAANDANDVIGSAEAALGLGGLWVHEHRSTFERARVLAAQQTALAEIDESSALAARLRVRLAAERAFESGDGSIVMAELANVGLQLTDSEWAVSADDWFLGENFDLVQYAVADGYFKPVGERIDAPDETEEITPENLING